jgi:hypothetical protein
VTDRPNSRYRADTDVNQINQTKPSHLIQCCVQVELKHRYKVRIFMDETVSFGTLGRTGRGVTEHYNVSVSVYCFQFKVSTLPFAVLFVCYLRRIQN